MENRRRSMYGGVDVGPIEQLAALVAQQQDLVDALELDKSEKNDTIHALTVSFALGSQGDEWGLQEELKALKCKGESEFARKMAEFEEE